MKLSARNQLAGTVTEVKLGNVMASVKVTHRAAITTSAEVGSLLRVIEGYEGHPITLAALRLLPHVFVRPGELRHAEWADFDLDAALWIIPAGKTKMRKPHHVPLSRQAVDLFREVQAITGPNGFVFPSIRTRARPMSENTMNQAFRRMGYANDDVTAHGLRTTGSTLLIPWRAT